MTSHPQPGVVLFVSDLQRVARFYRSVAGCTLLSERRDHLVLDASGLELVLYQIPDDLAGHAQDPSPGGQGAGERPAVREDAAIKLCLPVAGLAAARTRASELGGGLAGPSEEWDGDTYRACDGWDPEGNVVQFREPLATPG